jgi:hypothetical protein
METNIEILVADAAAGERLKRVVGSHAIRLRTELTIDSRPRLFFSEVSALSSAESLHRLMRMFESTWKLLRPPPAVFMTSGGGKSYSLGAIQGLASLFSRAGRKGIDPYVAPDEAALRRLVLAQKADSQQQLIASASLEDGRLVVWSCEPKRYEVGIDEVPALAQLGRERLGRLEVSTSGSRLRFPDVDVDLDLDAIRAYADPEVRKAVEASLRSEASRYADAIRQFREERGLTQRSIAGLSERQVRRLEEGETLPHSETLTKLASAHGLSVGEYLAELARRSRRGRSTAASTNRRRPTGKPPKPRPRKTAARK